jgi:transcriptional regulator with XRE-family HTH domain
VVILFDVRKFGAYLAWLRKSKDMTQSELSDILNVTRQAVSKYEKGDSFPDISILLLLAKT